MQKKIICLILAALMLLSLVAVPAMAAEDKLVIKLHYHREDGVYDDWCVWFWAEGKEGADYFFADENGEKVATYEVAPGDTKIGFIVKLPGWAAKDVNEDQFIEVVEVTSGTVHIYVESGVPGYEKVYGSDVATGVKLTKAAYDGDLAINVTMTAAVSGDPASAFKLLCDGEEFAPASIDANGTAYTINLSEKLNYESVYTITFDNKEYNVSMPNIFSTEDFEAQYTYTGNDLGATWTAEKTAFRVWAPTAKSVKVNLYQSGTEGTDDLIEQLEMTADVNGTWIAEKEGDLNGVYYTYSVEVKGAVTEACDPYAKTTGVNGKRAMVIDMASTNPEGWENDADPNAGINITDAVIYELHVRDLSIEESSGITNKGKYLGLIETGTKTPSGIATGLDHMKDLGITHLHILPMYDYGSVDESRLDMPQFNWGYDPVNYNVPEGSYSSDPFNGAVRVKEVKEMVKGLHENGISVVMDVVYNHVFSAESYCFNQIVPVYFSRTTESGGYSNGSGCGNDTASERSMVRKYIVDSVKYWADEYHIDGFRFDLVGLIDTQTINEIVAEVHKTHPNVIFYGEGWTMNTMVTKEGVDMCTQTNASLVPEFAFFSDTVRDALKGSVFENTEKGYVSGSTGFNKLLSKCFKGGPAWCPNPTQTINYVSCHDNNTLIDRITLSTAESSREDRVKMNNLAAAFCLTSQGVPFFQAGEEMLRTKPLPEGGFDHNSYASSDEVNSMKWETLDEAEVQTTYNYYKGLIAFRKAHPALRMTTKAEADANIAEVNSGNANVLAYTINGGVNGETAEAILVAFNSGANAHELKLPEGVWNIYVSGDKAGTEVLGTAEGTVSVDAISTVVLVKEAQEQPQPTEAPETTEAPAGDQNDGKGVSPALLAGAAAVAAAAVAGAAVILRKRKK